MFHIYLGERRTTVSVSETVAGLLAVKLGHTPETWEAHGAVRQWLQTRIDEHGNPERIRVSQWLQSEALLFLVDKNLSNRYLDWLVGEA